MVPDKEDTQQEWRKIQEKRKGRSWEDGVSYARRK
jgi:hypothetical protein